MSFAGKVAIVTGAAGGLGLEIAKAFLAQGAKVVLVDINEARLNEAINSLGTYQESALPLAIDITTEDKVKNIFFATFEKFGKVDVLVNNAGVTDKFDPVGSMDLDFWNKVMAVNLTAPMLMSKHAVDHFLSRDPAGGVVLNIASIGGVRGGRAGVAYTASKHGLIGLTKNTAAFYADKNIRCNAVLPSGMQTNIADSLAQGFNMEMLQKSMGVTLPQGPKYVDLDKVAATVLFLCSDAASMISGSCVQVDKGDISW